MPEKMRAALKINFSQRHKDKEAKFPQKTRTFLKRIMIYYFYFSTNCGPFEGGPGENPNVFNAFLLNTALLESLQVTLCS